MALLFLLHTFFILMLRANSCFGVESDIKCLRTLKNQLKDPRESLSSWTFTNSTEGFICEFKGIECWHHHENRVINIRLSNMGLRGRFPSSLENCTSLTGLDLSHNHLSGPIPSDISTKLRYVTKLDLSFNEFSGEIPSDISNCKYVNVLDLQNNQFMGKIPEQISNLTRLKTFNVSNNLISGEVPSLIQEAFDASSFANNAGLCGGPFGACRKPPLKKSHTSILIGSTVGAGLFLVLAIAVVFYYVRRARRRSRSTKKDPNPNIKGGEFRVKTTKRINDIELQSTKRRRSRNANISMFGQSITKMRLIDLLKATDKFNKDNIIGSGRRCTMHKGTLEDGSLVVVKRLRDCHRNSHKHFISEMETLGSTKHPNLVPLLGFCIARRERLLIYKYMRNGTLYQHLHQADGEGGKLMDWRQRLQISIGVARGLAWLHHRCDPPIIHRNISSRTILIDENFEPKVSDFRSARLMSSFATDIYGDEGYVAPEFEHVLDSIPKVDVYQFGLVMLELVTGREPTDQVANSTPENFNGNLVEWITHLSNFSSLQVAIDESLIGEGYDAELTKFLEVACTCVEFAPEKRPTMSEVCLLLNALGYRSNLLAEHRMFIPPNSISIECEDEIIVHQEIQE